MVQLGLFSSFQMIAFHNFSSILHVYRGDDDIRQGAGLLFFFIPLAKKARKSGDVRDRWKAQR